MRNALIFFVCAVFSIAGWGGSIYAAYRENLFWSSILFGAMMPFFCVVVLMSLNLAAFPLPYGVFGKLPRTPFPAIPPVRVFADSYGRVGKVRLTVPFINWHVFDCGLGVEISGFGRVFLPYNRISSIQKATLGRYTLFYAHSEVRSPIDVPADVFDAMKSSLPAEKLSE